MNGETIVTSLANNGIVTESNDDDTLRLTEEFEATLEFEFRAIEHLTDNALTKEIERVTEHDAMTQLLMESVTDHRNQIAAFLALPMFDADLPQARFPFVVTVLDQLHRGFPRSSGAPSSFMPIYGDQLELLLATTKQGVVFVWRDNCRPCRTMRTELERLFSEPREGFHLFAVYGPESAALLERNYDVVGGPTTLFVRDGGIDSRLQGAHHREVIENEIYILSHH